jgi:hypothetical protein
LFPSILSPRGDKIEGNKLPVTEKQIRPLKKLPPELRLRAWRNAVRAAASAPVAARHVEKEVRILMKAEGIKPPTAPRKANLRSHRLAEGAAEQIRALLAKIRKSVASGAVKRIPALLNEIEGLLSHW